MSSKGESVDLSELRDRLRRGRRTGRMYFDLGEREFTDEERARLLAEVVEEFASEGATEQDCVEMVGRAAARTGQSFDEALQGIHKLYVVCDMIVKGKPAHVETKQKAFRQRAQ